MTFNRLALKIQWIALCIALFACATDPVPAAPSPATSAQPGSTAAAAAPAVATPSATATVSPSAPASAVPLTLLTPATAAPTAAQTPTLPPATPTLPPRAFEHIFIIVFENYGAATAYANPYFKQLAARGAYLSNYYAVDHPSEPNYLAMLAGDTLVADDGAYNLPQKNLVDLLETAGIGWKTYQENYPGGCFAGSVAGGGLYARKHNPFISFDTIRGNKARCAKIAPASELDADLAAGRLPPYSFYTPNMDHDGHDRPQTYAAQWFESFIEPKLSDPNFIRDTLLVVTFDESEISASNQVYTALLGPMVKAGSVDGTRYTHYSLLRCVEDNFQLGTLNRKDAQAQSFAACNFSAGCGR